MQSLCRCEYVENAMTCDVIKCKCEKCFIHCHCTKCVCGCMSTVVHDGHCLVNKVKISEMNVDKIRVRILTLTEKLHTVMERRMIPSDYDHAAHIFIELRLAIREMEMWMERVLANNIYETT